MEVIDENNGYFVAEGIIAHEYAMANDYGKAWEAVYEYCCRNKALKNNRNTKYVNNKFYQIIFILFLNHVQVSSVSDS